MPAFIDFSSEWLPVPVGVLDLHGLGWYYPSGAANAIGFDVLLCTIVAAAAMCFVGHLALLIARRRRALIAHGLAHGFLAQSSTAAKGAPSSGGATPNAPALEATGYRYAHGRATSKVHELPFTASEVVAATSKGKVWDEGCAMVHEGAPVFTEPLETMALVEFFARPLFTQAFAAIYGAYRLSVVALDAAKCVLAVRMAAHAIAHPCHAVVGGSGDLMATLCAVGDGEETYATDSAIVIACFVAAFAIGKAQRVSAIADTVVVTAMRLSKLAILGALGFYLVRAALTADAMRVEAKRQPLRDAAAMRHGSLMLWLVAVKAVTLTFESHGLINSVFNALPGGQLGRVPGQNLGKAHGGGASPSAKLAPEQYTFGATRKLFHRAVAMTLGQMAVVVSIVWLTMAAHPDHDGALPLPAHIAREGIHGLSRRSDAADAWTRALAALAALTPMALVLPGLSFSSLRAAGLLRYGIWGTPRSWDPSTVRFSSAYIGAVVAITASVHDSAVWGMVLYVAGSAFTFVYPFIIWRFSRLAVRRLRIPRRLDAALHLTPTVSRAATAIGGAWFALITAHELGVI